MIFSRIHNARSREGAVSSAQEDSTQHAMALRSSGIVSVICSPYQERQHISTPRSERTTFQPPALLRITASLLLRVPGSASVRFALPTHYVFIHPPHSRPVFERPPTLQIALRAAARRPCRRNRHSRYSLRAIWFSRCKSADVSCAHAQALENVLQSMNRLNRSLEGVIAVSFSVALLCLLQGGGSDWWWDLGGG